MATRKDYFPMTKRTIAHHARAVEQPAPPSSQERPRRTAPPPTKPAAEVNQVESAPVFDADDLTDWIDEIESEIGRASHAALDIRECPKEACGDALDELHTALVAIAGYAYRMRYEAQRLVERWNG